MTVSKESGQKHSKAAVSWTDTSQPKHLPTKSPFSRLADFKALLGRIFCKVTTRSRAPASPATRRTTRAERPSLPHPQRSFGFSFGSFGSFGFPPWLASDDSHIETGLPPGACRGGFPPSSGYRSFEGPDLDETIELYRNDR